MKDLNIIKKLMNDKITESDLKYTDCYIRPQLSILIPTADEEPYAEKMPFNSYSVTISFDAAKTEKPAHYHAEITSPMTFEKHTKGNHYYRILIDKEYFEKRYLMYSDNIPIFESTHFEFCSDILKALNTFVFEYSKSMLNSDITLDAQSEIITHWMIRSIFGETLDMRSVSSDYSVAKAQHYMEQHYSEHITITKLAALGYISPSAFNRRFKKETGITPIEYLIEIRINNSKNMLKRKSIPITEIALRCGFGSNAHFSSCFQMRTGLSPTEYRERYSE
ncbi:MAG: helix-turn-helix transcriptional regulator [Oscillospiraceae bacterium]|nr:helix-turn-helix transcriptional regulator [Oscillospiraceae bacterium]